MILRSTGIAPYERDREALLPTPTPAARGPEKRALVTTQPFPGYPYPAKFMVRLMRAFLWGVKAIVEGSRHGRARVEFLEIKLHTRARFQRVADRA